MPQKGRDNIVDLMTCPDEGRDELEEHLRKAAKQIVACLSDSDAVRRKELLGSFVSELFFAFSEEERRAERRQKQVAGIAAAKARGTRFGPAARVLPDNFYEVHKAWRDRKMTLREAADACGMPKSTFRDAALRTEAKGDMFV